MSASELANVLGGKKQGSGWIAHCPAHEDQNPSLSISEGDDGRPLFYCHAGCEQGRVLDAITSMDHFQSHGRQAASQNSARAGQHTRMGRVPEQSIEPDLGFLLGEEPSEVWTYRAPLGQLLGFVARIDCAAGGKTYRPVTPWQSPAGELVWKAKGFEAPLPLFGQEQLAAVPQCDVLVVEGEKAASAAAKLFPDHVVLSWPSGAGAASRADWRLLEGRRVTLWPDADEPGLKAMQDVARRLAEVGAKEIKLVGCPDHLPKGWDLADPIPAGFDINYAFRNAVSQDPSLARFILSGPAILQLDVPPQEFILGTFMPTNSLSMVFAERGLGKTWFCLSMAVSIAEGEDFFGYHVPKARRVLYIDGEMALGELKERLRALCPNPPEIFEVLPSELLYREDDPINLHMEEDQTRLLAALARKRSRDENPELIIIDNLSSLASGVDENSNSDLDALLRFLLELRHSGYSVLLVHHAGKNKGQRGASRREDFLNLSIELRRPEAKKGVKRKENEHEGAHFILEFSKVRGKPPRPSQLDLKLSELPGGRVEWTIDNTPKVSKEDEVLRYIAEKEPDTQKQICNEFGLSAGRISQICKQLREFEYLYEDPANPIRISSAGGERVLSIWPELSNVILKQDDLPI